MPFQFQELRNMSFMLRVSLCWCLCTVLSAAGLSQQQQYDAEAQLLAMEAKIEAYRMLPAEKRMKAELGLGAELERLERKIRGTKANNRLLYLLADWHVTYDIDDAKQYMDGLASSAYSAHKGSLDIVRIRYHLLKGETGKARALVDQLTIRIPQFENYAALVSLYEKRGEDAPQMEGNNLSGDSKNPVAESKEKYLLYCFTELNDDWKLYQFKEVCKEFKREEFQKDFKIVCVSFDHKYISALSAWNEIAEGTNWDLMWANPAPKGDSERWKEAWGVESTPATILISGDRKIFDVNPDLNDLRVLAGLKKQSKKTSGGNVRNSSKKKKGPRWR